MIDFSPVPDIWKREGRYPGQKNHSFNALKNPERNNTKKGFD